MASKSLILSITLPLTLTINSPLDKPAIWAIEPGVTFVITSPFSFLNLNNDLLSSLSFSSEIPNFSSILI